MLAEAIDAGASVVVSYHTPIFFGLKSLKLSNPLQKTLMTCAAEGISVYCPHSALDSVWGGINDWLAKGFVGENEMPSVTALVKEMRGPDGESEGAEGRLVELPTPTPMSVLEQRIKKYLGRSHSAHMFLELFLLRSHSHHYSTSWLCLCPSSQDNTS